MSHTEIPVNRCRPAAYNPRRTRDEEVLAQLVESVRQHGVLVPILARPVKENGKTCYEVVAGSRRLAAARIAKLPHLPAVVREMSDVEAMEICVLENLQREMLDPIDEARGVAALRDLAGWDAPEVARRLARSERWVHQRMGFLELPEEAQQAISAGSLSLAPAQLLLDLRPEERETALGEILHPTYQEQPLAGWQACRLIERSYLVPYQLRRKWEKLVASGRLRKEWPGAVVVQWGEEPDGGWFEKLEDSPLPYTLAVWARGQKVPTWGELAEVHGAQVYVFPDDEAEPYAAVDAEALMDAEKTRCAECGEKCIFPQTGPGSGEARHQQDLEAAKAFQAQEAEERREREALVDAVWHYDPRKDGKVTKALLEYLVEDWGIGEGLTGSRLGRSNPTEDEILQEVLKWAEEFGVGAIQRIIFAEEALRTTVRSRVETLLAPAGIEVDSFPTLFPEE